MKDNEVNKLSMGARMLRVSLSMRERLDTGENIDKKRKSKEVFDFIDIDDDKRKIEQGHKKPINIDNIEDDPNDDVCLLCGHIGTLLYCNNCPSAFHRSCLNMKEVPSSDWNCCICKFCGLIDSNTNQAGSTHAQSESLDHTCRVCKRKYHKSCLEANCARIVHSNDALLCENKCQEKKRQRATYKS